MPLVFDNTDVFVIGPVQGPGFGGGRIPGGPLNSFNAYLAIDKAFISKGETEGAEFVKQTNPSITYERCPLANILYGISNEPDEVATLLEDDKTVQLLVEDRESDFNEVDLNEYLSKNHYFLLFSNEETYGFYEWDGVVSNQKYRIYDPQTKTIVLEAPSIGQLFNEINRTQSEIGRS